MNRTHQWLSNIERETRSISADELAQVANILDVSPSVFFNKELDETSKKHKRKEDKHGRLSQNPNY
jgi:transcriptional regulator with XRE-family HTH domain